MLADLPEHLSTLSENFPDETLQEKMRQKMIELVPELNSEYARFPIRYERWLHPEESQKDGTPCYIPYDADDQNDIVVATAAVADTEPPRKKDYVYLPTIPRTTSRPQMIMNAPSFQDKDNGENHGLRGGYYHLLTKEAYLRVNYRIQQYQPSPLEAMMHRLNMKTTAEEKESHELYEKVADLIRLRLESEVPNDVLAYRLRALHYRRRFSLGTTGDGKRDKSNDVVDEDHEKAI